jgi:hypothetical protein
MRMLHERPHNAEITRAYAAAPAANAARAISPAVAQRSIGQSVGR